MTQHDIIQSIKNEVAAITETVKDLDETTFFKMPHPEKWSIAQNLVHLFQSVKGLVGLFGTPSKMDGFGKSDRSSKSYEDIKAAYQKILSVPLPPPFNGFRPIDTEGSVSEVMANFQSIHARLLERFALFSEADLDTYQIPHPVMGLLTMREIMQFTAYHTRHHHLAIKNILTHADA
jgi:hypothetical protein